MKPTKPLIPSTLSKDQASLLIEIIDSLLEYLVDVQQALRRTHFHDEQDDNVHGWYDHIPF